MESQWLRDAIGISPKLSVCGDTISANDKHDPLQGDPRLRKLVEGILYSRSFVLTYHIVISSFILLFSVIHWTQKVARWRQTHSYRLRALNGKYAYDRNDSDAEAIEHPCRGQLGSTGGPGEAGSPGSSTLGGATSPPHKVDEYEVEDEVTPLLHHGHTLRPLYPHQTAISTIKSMLIYQPSPIPTFNKILPSNGSAAVILAFIGLNLFYLLFHINFNLFEVLVLADRFGLMFVVNLPLLYILAAKNQPLEFLTGRSYESLNIFHRRLGELLCLQAFVHAAGMVVVWYNLVRPNGFSFTRFLLLWTNLLGIGALFSYEFLYFTSLATFRERWYELFLALHILFQVAALTFVFFHHSSSRPYVGVALCIFLVDRLVYRFWAKSSSVEATAQILEDEETVKLTSTITLRPRSWIFGRSITRGWKATDHVFLTVPSLSNKHNIQAHPFTIISAPPTPNNQNPKLELLIRAQDGFSRDLLNAAHLHKYLQIRLDGPYGSSHVRDMLEDSDIALVIAGGSGIAVGWPLIQHLLNTNRSFDTEMAPTSLLQRKVILIWVIHEASQSSWLGRQAVMDARNCGVDILILPPTDEVGRPDLRGMINELATKYATEKGKKMRVVASGPGGMGRLVRNTCARLVKEGYDVDVDIEKFGW